MFCQCYFNAAPRGHFHGEEGGEEQFCRFNVAHRVNRGHYGALRLDGAKFWLAGDLGEFLTGGEVKWAVLHFDPMTAAAQREALHRILGQLVPLGGRDGAWPASPSAGPPSLQRKSFTVGEALSIDWRAEGDRAEARLDGGRAAVVLLQRDRANPDDRTVMKNLRYWAAPRNDGFALMPTLIQAYRGGDRPFEFRGTSGFVLTYEVASEDDLPTSVDR